MKKLFIVSSVVIPALILAWAFYWIYALLLLVVVAPFIYMGISDMIQTRQSIRRNFPLFGRLRYVFDEIQGNSYSEDLKTQTTSNLPQVLADNNNSQAGDNYQYVSGCNLKSEMGRMHGTYVMENLDTRQTFEVNIPAFEMITPFKYN